MPEHPEKHFLDYLLRVVETMADVMGDAKNSRGVAPYQLFESGYIPLFGRMDQSAFGKRSLVRLHLISAHRRLLICLLRWARNPAPSCRATSSVLIVLGR